MAPSCLCLVLVALSASGAASQQCDGVDPSGPDCVENATVLIQAGRTIASSSSSSWQMPIARAEYSRYALWPGDATRRRFHAPAGGRECSHPQDCKDEAICSSDGTKKCKKCTNGASCFSAFEKPGKDEAGHDAPIVVDDVDDVPPDYPDELFVCACIQGEDFATLCTDHSACVSEAGCTQNSGAGVKPCGDCSKGKTCGGEQGLNGGTSDDPYDPPRSTCKCGGDWLGVAKCGGFWGDCKDGYACDTSSGIGSKKCKHCNSGYRCKKKSENADIGKCKCKR